MVKAEIEAAIAKALQELGAGEARFVVERPANMEHGDYATNAALSAAKLLKKNPKEVAESLASMLIIDGVKKVEAVGPGFVNFTLAGLKVKDIVHEAHEAGWGSNDLYKDKKIMVEYTDPNPFKEFHIGHLMSNAIGESVARVLEAAGATVTRANYQGDVGLHVAKAIWGMQNLIKSSPDIYGDTPYLLNVEKWGTAYKLGSAAYEQNNEAKEQINLLNKIIYEKSDTDINALYDEGRKSSLEHFEELYKVLGTTFNKYFFESETWERGLKLVKANIGNFFEESEGAVIYRGEQDGLHTRVFINKAGLPTYEAKDLGLLALKKDAGSFDVSVTITASEQKEYFKVVLAAAKHVSEVAGIAAKTQHITHGMMRFAEGKMSSRTGNVITGESLLSDLTSEAKVKMDGRELKDTSKTGEQVAVGAIKYTVLRQDSNKDIIFDPEKSLSLEGDSGPYVQYALVRARSILRKAATASITEPEPSSPTPIERLLVHFPEVLARAATELEPHYVVTYVTELAAAFNSWYAQERLIIDGTISKRSLAVLKAVENTLAKGLQVLGIPTPEEM